MLAPYIEQFVDWLRSLAPQGSYLSESFILIPCLAILLVSLICGSVGSLVIGNRMSFFSDALAHCAFAGVALGILIALATGVAITELREPQSRHFITLVMVAFGILIGVLIAFVREKTSLSNDTVIGVFFAGAIGLGAMLLKAV